MQKGAGTKEKRRFTPKAQVKAEPVLTVTHEPSTVPTTTTASKGSDGGGGRGGKGRGGHGRGGAAGKRGGRGGRFVVPTGQAFFTGGSASAPIPSSGASYNIGHAQESSVSRTASGVKEEKIDSHVKAENDAGATAPTVGGEKLPRSCAEDEDEEEEMTTEWPPPAFNALHPVALPFGPSTLDKRVQLAEQTIFADTNDRKAMEREEDEAVFLLQLPSSIAQGSFVPPEDVHAAGGISAIKPRKQLKPGKLGKIQITQSGKIFLVVTEEDEDGELAKGGDQSESRVRRYEINRGITPSFMQVVASITTKALPGSSGSDAVESQSSTALRDEMHLLGTVTDKIVVTPDFDIGQRGGATLTSPQSQESEQQEAGSGSSGGAMDIIQGEVTKVMNIKREVM